MQQTIYEQKYHRNYGQYVNICFSQLSTNWDISYFFSLLILFYLLPCIVLFVLYGKLVLVIRNRSKKNFETNTIEDINYNSKKNNFSELLSEMTKNTDLNGKCSKPFRNSGETLKNISVDQANCLLPHLNLSVVINKKESTEKARKSSTRSTNSNKTENKKNYHQLPQINQKQIIILLIIMMLLIFICLLPYKVFSVWVVLADKEKLKKLGMVNYHILLTLCRVAFHTNSALNPIFYHILSTKFQNAFKKFFGSSSQKSILHSANHK